MAEGATERVKVSMFRVGTRMPTVSRTEGQLFVPLKTFIKNNASKWRRLICIACKFSFSNIYNEIYLLDSEMFVSSLEIDQKEGNILVVNVWNTKVLTSLSLLSFKTTFLSFCIIQSQHNIRPGDFVLIFVSAGIINLWHDKFHRNINAMSSVTMRSQFFTAVTMNITVFLDMTTCSLADRYRCFVGTGRWRQKFLSKRLYLPTRLHGVTSQKKVIFTFIPNRFSYI
jgi:hypothetical protein